MIRKRVNSPSSPSVRCIHLVTVIVVDAITMNKVMVRGHIYKVMEVMMRGQRGTYQIDRGRYEIDRGRYEIDRGR